MNGRFIKVHIFWDGHKFLQNLHRRFVLCSNGQIYSGDFAKLCGLLRIYGIYLKKTFEDFKIKLLLATTQSDNSLYIPSVPRYLRTAFSGSRKSFNLPDFDKEGSVWSLSLSLASSLSLTSLPPLPTRYFWTACFRFRFWKIR